MAKALFRQVDMERVFKAAANAGSVVQIDMKTMIATVFRAAPESLVDEYGNPLGVASEGNSVQTGKEHWDED